MILAIDPGTRESGWCEFDGKRVSNAGVIGNEAMVTWLATPARWQIAPTPFVLAIEKIEAMGMAVGAEVFETVHWSGRFLQAWHTPDQVVRVTRRAVKLHLCGNMRAKDPNIRQALIDALGPVGTKAKPGPTYGVKSHAWAALAVAVTALHQLGQQVEAQPAPLFREPAPDPFAELEHITATEVKQRREEWLRRQTLPESPVVEAITERLQAELHRQTLPPPTR